MESLSHYTGRVAFAFSPTKSATIILNDTRGLDSGIYQCSVTNPPDTSTPNIGVVRLTVFGTAASPSPLPFKSNLLLHRGNTPHVIPSRPALLHMDSYCSCKNQDVFL